MIATTNSDDGAPNDFLKLILANPTIANVKEFTFLNNDFVDKIKSFQLRIETSFNSERKLDFIFYIEQDIEVSDHLDQNGKKYANPIRMSPYGKWSNYDMTQKDIGTELNEK
jgi:hypothetical protein